ncbi:MAG: hydrogenase maturation protease [Methanospirillum sp.]|nr:hydrogenase maturation protease [Methanospirillum sp.]
MPEDPGDIQAELDHRLRGVDPARIVVAGVGNRMRRDDAIGPVLLDALQGSLPHLIDAGTVPEEYTGVIKRCNPSVIVFLDALDLGTASGTIRILEPEEIADLRRSAHGLSLDLILQYLAGETGAEVFVIGIQYGEVTSEPGLSPGIQEAVRICAGMIRSSILVQKKDIPEENTL